MPWKFNPFSGTLDQTGSGGGGASYIDGEVNAYADLSLDAGAAPLNSAWLVRSGSGVWPFNKPPGIYYRSATLGASRDADYTYGGTLGDVFSDSVFLLYDEANTTRTAQFNLGNITDGQNRVLIVPNASGTIALTSDITGGGFGEVRFDTATVYTYTGLADAGALESASVWFIRRSEYSSAGAYVSTTTANNVEWDDRLTASYT